MVLLWLPGLPVPTSAGEGRTAPWLSAGGQPRHRQAASAQSTRGAINVECSRQV